MSHWNYRVYKFIPKNKANDPYFLIRETYYNDDGKANGFTLNSASPFGETEQELKNDIQYMLEAFGKPVIEQEEE